MTNVADLPMLIAQLRAEQSDTPSIEVKSAAGGMPSDIEKTICALTNLPGGGLIILGLDERAGFIPVSLRNVNDLKAGLASIARQALTPPAAIEISEEQFEGKTVVIGKVVETPTALKPSRLQRNGNAYMRFWDGDYRLSDLEVEGFIVARQTPRFDTEPVAHARREDLDRDLVATFLDAVRQTDQRFARRADDELLQRLGVLTNEGTITTAGLLALGDYPQQYFPNFCIQAATTPEPGAPPSVRVGDTAHFTGPLGHMIDLAVEWTRKHSRHRIVDRADGRVVDQYDFPTVAVRELVANSLVHRDLAPWSWSRATELRIDATQLRIVNPGGLYGVPIERFGRQPISSARNGQLLRICQYTHTADGRTVEALATGIPRVFAETEAQGLPRPSFFDQALTFTAILHRPPAVAASTQPEADSRHARVPEALQEVLAVLAGGPRSRAEIGSTLGLDDEATRARLNRLRRDGLIDSTGGRGAHNTTYALTRPQPK